LISEDELILKLKTKDTQSQAFELLVSTYKEHLYWHIFVELYSIMRDAMALSEVQAITLLEQLKVFKTEEEKLNNSYLNEIKRVLSAKNNIAFTSFVRRF
jgi:hypothetical protein